MTDYRVVFHLDEPSRGRAEQVLGNLANLLNDLGEQNVAVELLANGGGVRMLLTEAEWAGRIAALQTRGVRFVACANSLAHLELDPANLLPGVEVVPAGVSELVKKQAQGWAYIRP